MGLKLFGGRRGKRDREPAAPQEAAPERAAPPETLDLERPLDGLSVGFMFPLAFQVGDVPVRARPLRMRTGPEAFVEAPGSQWFFWKAETPSGKLSAFWQLPGPSGDGKEAEAWARTSRTLAAAAAAQLKAALSSRPGTTPSSFSAGPCRAPDMQGKPAFRADFRYAARGAFREGSAYAGVRYPHILAGALGCGDEAAADDAIGAMVAASGAMMREAPDGFWAARSFRFAGTRSGPYLPIYELLNLLSDGDARLATQNNLVIKAPGAALGALFLYRGTVRTPEGVRERVEPPHSFDPQRVYPFMPPTVFEDGRLDAANAAADADDFLRRNDEAYEELFQAVRRDTLSLSPEGAALIRSVYVTQVYSAKRRAFDALVEAGKPFDEFRKLPEPIARRAVDTSGAEPIAAAVYGSEDALAFVARWCSRRKRDAIAEELGRIGSSLAEGIADIDVIMTDRNALMERAAAIIEADRRETAAAGGRGKKG